MKCFSLLHCILSPLELEDTSLALRALEQISDDHLEERKKKMSYFNWWNLVLCCGLLLGVTVIVYVQEKVSWRFADLILTIVMTVTILTFYMGKIIIDNGYQKGVF
ncbi:hypothetical protein CRYUN_Cryun05aG0155800 [Craigia yunnanensis]